jgi:DNA-binding transcriptional regulator YdaS (Cro superfamily)
MQLKEYLNSTTQEEFAKVIGVTQGTVSHWITGRSLVPIKTAKLIEEKTSGQVSRFELRPDVWEPPPKTD